MKEHSKMKKRNATAVVAAKVPRDESSDMTTALNVHLNEIVFPKGVETLGQKANFLHGYSVEASKRANGAAIMAGWVLSVARSASPSCSTSCASRALRPSTLTT